MSRVSVDIVQDEALIGEVWLMVINDIGQLGYCLPQHLRGCGLCTKFVKALCWYAFDNTSIEKIITHAHPTNAASIRVLEKAGFVQNAPPEIESYGLIDHFHFVLSKQDWSKIEQASNAETEL